MNINDESDGITQYNIPGQVIVEPNNHVIYSLGQNILHGINNFQNVSLQSIAPFMNSFASMLNSQSSNVSKLKYYLFKSCFN